jgi:tRNA pseudouridine13 synthase
MPELVLTNTKPVASGVLKQQPEAFAVTEQLGWEPLGEGEHISLWVSKKGKNTRYVLSEIARYSNIQERNISYSGMKDKQALTTKWFSLHVPGKQNIAWTNFAVDGVSIDKVVRHNRKLRRGTHKANHFAITIKNIDGDQSAVDAKLDELKNAGFPNFFGEQRFGFNGNNLTEFSRWTELAKGRPRNYDLYLSAARSHLFNKVLKQRQTNNTWNTIVSGDVAMLDGSSSVFPVVECDAEITQRCGSFDIHPTAPLWGKGDLRTSASVAQLEHSVADEFTSWCHFLGQQGLKQERRAARAQAKNLHWQWLDNTTVKIEFELAKGCYATSLLAEVFDLKKNNNEGKSE